MELCKVSPQYLRLFNFFNDAVAHVKYVLNWSQFDYTVSPISWYSVCGAQVQTAMWLYFPFRNQQCFEDYWCIIGNSGLEYFDSCFCHYILHFSCYIISRVALRFTSQGLEENMAWQLLQQNLLPTHFFCCSTRQAVVQVQMHKRVLF
jgi:hypothetical protein